MNQVMMDFYLDYNGSYQVKEITGTSSFSSMRIVSNFLLDRTMYLKQLYTVMNKVKKEYYDQIYYQVDFDRVFEQLDNLMNAHETRINGNVRPAHVSSEYGFGTFIVTDTGVFFINDGWYSPRRASYSTDFSNLKERQGYVFKLYTFDEWEVIVNELSGKTFGELYALYNDEGISA